MHNVLKGVRILTPRLADKMLLGLGLSLLDLVEAHEFRAAAERMWLQNLDLIAVPLAGGRLGPGEEWPDFNAAPEWIPLNRHEISGVLEPVVVRLGPDPRLPWTISLNTLALLEKEEDARRNLAPGCWYVLLRGSEGTLGQAQSSGGRWHVGELAAPAGRSQHLNLVRAKVVWVGEDPRAANRLAQRGRFLDATSV